MGPGFPRPAVCVSRTGVAPLIWVAWLLELVESLTRIVMAGKGFTVKKNWDNPKEHAMPAEARVPAEVRLGTVLVAPATVLAPMAGVTDTVFRRFIRHASSFTTGQNAGKIESGVQPCQGTTSQAAEKHDSEGAGGF